MSDCFYEPLDRAGARWRPTVHTTGPWDARFQHAGPPSALLGRALERCAARDDTMVARVTVELLGPVPVAELALRVRVSRPGRSVELVEAALSAEGRDVARAGAWRILRTAAAAVPDRRPAPPALPPEGPPLATGEWVRGFLDAVEWRVVAGGGFLEPGPATAWARLRHPLVDGEQTSPLQRVLAIADSGNGLSSELDLTRWHFINPELTVHVHREPVGDWLCLDAATTISTGGVGLATGSLSDQLGPVAVAAQSLLVAPRQS
ncbi:MAG TPA: thioesterase family protein [Mycobacteriales bacterium]|nr:thioesterase family protein [Mycobacteriales bacterium]